MNLTKTKEIREVTDYKKANELLKDGWQLLDVYRGKDGFTYVLFSSKS